MLKVSFSRCDWCAQTGKKEMKAEMSGLHGEIIRLKAEISDYQERFVKTKLTRTVEVQCDMQFEINKTRRRSRPTFSKNWPGIAAEPGELGSSGVSGCFKSAVQGVLASQTIAERKYSQKISERVITGKPRNSVVVASFPELPEGQSPRGSQAY